MLSSGLLQSAVAFAANLILVRHIDPAGFGRWALAMAGVSVAQSVLSLRLGVQIIRLKDTELDDEARRTYFTAILFESLLATVVSACWLALGGLLDPWTVLLLLALGGRHVVTSARSFFERGDRQSSPYRKLALAEGLSSVSTQVVACAVALLGAGAAALYVRELVLTIALIVSLRAAGGLRFPGLTWIDLRGWRSLANKTGGLWVDGTLEGVFERLLILFAGIFGGSAGAGLFFQARSLALLPHRLLAPVVGRLSLNWFSRAETAAERRTERDRLLGFLLPGLLILALATFFLAEPVVPWLLGDRFAGSGPVLVHLTGTVLAFSLFASMKAYLLSSRQMRLLFVARIAQFLGLALPLLPALSGRPVDVADVATGTSLAYLFALAATGVACRRSEQRAEDRRPLTST